jgi:hypothetical protein
VPFEQVWGLLVDGALEPGLPPAEPHPLTVRSGDPRVDVQAALAELRARKPDRVLATNRLIRPTAKYVGPAPRSLQSLAA